MVRALCNVKDVGQDILIKICCATNTSEDQASSSSSGKTAYFRKRTLAASIIDCKGLASNLSLGAHSARVSNGLLRSWRQDLSKRDVCQSASSTTFQVVWSGCVCSGVETNEPRAAVGCRSRRLNEYIRMVASIEEWHDHERRSIWYTAGKRKRGIVQTGRNPAGRVPCRQRQIRT